MLAAGLLAHALRGGRQRAVGSGRALVAAAAAWQQLQVGEQGPGAGKLYGSLSSGSHSWLSGASSFSGSSFSSSAVVSSSNQASGTDDSGSTAKRPRPRDAGGRFISHTAEPQPQLQDWLQQGPGLAPAEADQYARRLAHIFGSQQAALHGLPATFEWCRSRGLTGLQTAQLLDQIGKRRHLSVVHFASTAQLAWQLIDSHIAAHVEPLQRAGAKLPTHTSLAEVLCSNKVAAKALAMPPGSLEAWMAAVSPRLPAAAIGRLLLSTPNIVCGSPVTALAAITWAVDVLCVPDPAAFFATASTLLSHEVSTLQRNLDSLQQALGWAAAQARQLALKRPGILTSSPETVHTALAWLRQFFPDAEQLADVIDRGPQLLEQSEQRLQGNADYLRQELGWQDGDGQLAALVATYPQPFATVNLSDEDTEHKLRLLSEVVGVSRQACLTSGLSYLKTGLKSMAANYMLAQERAPQMLFNKAGELQLSWIVTVSQAQYRGRLGLSGAQLNAFVREWPASQEGRRLLEGLRACSVDGWPRPPSWEEAQQRRQAAAEQQAGGEKRRGASQKRRAAAEKQQRAKSVQAAM